jgi:hypothetical protein
MDGGGVAATRRRFLGVAAAAAGSLALGGCGGPGARAPAPGGSTLRSTWGDPPGDGQLRVLAGEPLLARHELGPAARPGAVLATLAHLTDAHVLDASSPARVTFLDRLGPPFQSTFRPQEALSLQVLAGAVAAVRALAPDLVIQGGDLIDNDQSNELAQALAVLAGGAVRPGSGPHGYYGVQLASDADPFYYRPDVDAPRHPGLLRAAVASFRGGGLGRPWCPVLGDHDALVAGELVPSAETRSLAVGDRALWDLPSGLALPPGFRAQVSSSPDGPVLPSLVGELLREAFAGPTRRVPADGAWRQLSFAEAVARLRAAAGRAPAAAPRLDYVVDLGARLRLIVLDLARRGGGSGGLVRAGQPEFVARAVAGAGGGAGAGGRWVIAVSHQPLGDSAGGEAILAELDRSPLVIATLAGHTHRNRVVPRHSSAGGYWQIETASLIDYPQQARALRLVATAGGGVAIHTWMLDHVAAGRTGGLGRVSRELAYLDAQGGRPGAFAGTRLDRNVILYRAGA